MGSLLPGLLLVALYWRTWDWVRLGRQPHKTLAGHVSKAERGDLHIGRCLPPCWPPLLLIF